MSAWILYYHPESECLFWSQSREEDPLCSEIGSAPKKSRSTAENIWSLLPNRRDFPAFADIYREKEDELAAAEDSPRGADLFEPVPRWAGAPRVCVYENLLAFDSAKEMGGFLKQDAPSMYAIKQWECPVCGKWHMLTGQPPVGHKSPRPFTPRLPRAVREKLLSI